MQWPGAPRDAAPTLICVLGPCKGEARVGEQALSLSLHPPPQSQHPLGCRQRFGEGPLSTSGAHYAEKLERLRIQMGPARVWINTGMIDPHQVTEGK